MSVLVVTGTDTGVGKTVATAALACHARLAGIDVAVCKPVQTGSADGDDDLGRGRRGCPESPNCTARAPSRAAGPGGGGRTGRGAAAHAQRIWARRSPTVDRPGRLTLVEGAGGLLVEIGAGGVTLRDLALDLAAPVLVVVSKPGLGTLNHTALTLEALASHNVWCAGLVIGAWPREPGIVERVTATCFRRWRRCGRCCRTGAGAVSAADFESMSRSAFDSQWVTSLVG